ncbi:hypothetical protein VCHENC02_4858A, partial [Vibrio harveyi]
MTKAEGY